MLENMVNIIWDGKKKEELFSSCVYSVILESIELMKYFHPFFNFSIVSMKQFPTIYSERSHIERVIGIGGMTPLDTALRDN